VLTINDGLRFGSRLRRSNPLGETLLKLHILSDAFIEVLQDQRVGIYIILRDNEKKQRQRQHHVCEIQRELIS
jgi:hypothetical protein